MTVITPIGGIGEKELSRAIQLELKLRECQAEISENDAHTRIFVMHTLDESKAEEVKASKSENKICCFFENTVPLPDGAVSAVRPFLLKSLCDHIAKRPRTSVQTEQNDMYIEGKNVIYMNQKISLSRNELKLFTLLYENRGKAVSREDIVSKIWNGSDTNIADVYIRYLRKKLDESFDKKLIITVRNKGYMLR